MPKWTFACAADGTSYQMEIGPTRGFEEAFRRSVGSGFTPSPGAPAVVLMRPAEALTASMQGTLLSQAQYQAMQTWWKKASHVTVTDLLGRVWTVQLTVFDPKRVRSASHPWKHTWTVDVDILSVSIP